MVHEVTVTDLQQFKCTQQVSSWLAATVQRAVLQKWRRVGVRGQANLRHRHCGSQILRLTLHTAGDRVTSEGGGQKLEGIKLLLNECTCVFIYIVLPARRRRTPRWECVVAPARCVADLHSATDCSSANTGSMLDWESDWSPDSHTYTHRHTHTNKSDLESPAQRRISLRFLFLSVKWDSDYEDYEQGFGK